MNEGYYCINHMNGQIFIITSLEIINLLRNALFPYILIEDSSFVEEGCWVIHSCESYYSDCTNMKLFKRERKHEPDTLTWYDEKKKLFLISYDDISWIARCTERLIRNLIRWLDYSADNFYLHGGAVKISNKGVCFLGSKNCGKTSIIMNLLSSKENDICFVVNDDLKVIIKNNYFTVYGSPRKMGIKIDTIEYISGLSKYVDKNCLEIMNNKIFLRPSDIKMFTGACIETSVGIDGIIFPHYASSEKDIGITRLDSDEAYKHLYMNLEKLPDKHSDFFIDFMKIPPIEDIKIKLQAISKSIPCYQLYHLLDKGEETRKFVYSIL